MDMGWQAVPASALNTQQKISLPTVNVKEAGYIFVYLSYEDQSNNYVEFDDMKITLTKTNVVQYNEYYPFGLQTDRSWTRDNSKNNFLYNGGSEINANSGWYETFYRGYDPALGRFMQVDPKAASVHDFSPYNYANGNPTLMNDPHGDRPKVYTDPKPPMFSYDPGWLSSIWATDAANGEASGGPFSTNIVGGGGFTLTIGGYEITVNFADMQDGMVSFSLENGEITSASISNGDLINTGSENYFMVTELYHTTDSQGNTNGVYTVNGNSWTNYIVPINSLKSSASQGDPQFNSSGPSNSSGWGLSFYDGVPLVSSPWVPSKTAFTPGPFIVKSPNINPKTNQLDRDLIRHEIGHVLTFAAMGLSLPLYVATIAIPSVVNFQTGLGGDHYGFYTEQIANTLSEFVYGPFEDKETYPSYTHY